MKNIIPHLHYLLSLLGAERFLMFFFFIVVARSVEAGGECSWEPAHDEHLAAASIAARR
ncbi:MAG: hypothetical protein IJ197_04975 [Bacteroidaceae bacterium]|nr:hypothetical protein [Bacteroidaceae bacterium]